MKERKKANRAGEPPVKIPQLPRDLPDFHLRWPEFRSCILALTQNSCLCSEERALVGWLIKLADRVGQRDIGA